MNKIKIEKVFGYLLLAIVIGSICVFLINKAGLLLFLEALGITVAIIISITASVFLITKE